MAENPSWKRMVSAILGLPSIGPKMAERIALSLLRHTDKSKELEESLQQARERLKKCPECGDFVESESTPPPHCSLCLDPSRETTQICVVEEPGDLQAMERTRAFHGKYHILGGVLSALDGIGPEELRLSQLRDRVNKQGITEIIIATNPTTEGETTASYLADLFQSTEVKVTRLAYGLPSGSVIQYADEYTLSQALAGRRLLSTDE